MPATAERHDFVVVANRLPVDIHIDEAGKIHAKPSPGGLVAALQPVLEQRRGGWVGWPGTVGDAPEPFSTDGGIRLHPVALSQHDFEEFYEGFSNATLWPLYHDLIMRPRYHRPWWQAYERVNLRFAQRTAEVAAPNAVVWVQDYQLQLVPGMLKAMRPDLKIGLFLHIPFPPPSLFLQLPWRDQILEGMLGADVLGFQLPSCASNFQALAPQAADRIHAFPISIDTGAFASTTDTERTRERFGNPDTLLLGVDRLDYTKGILQRLEAFEELLEEGLIDAERTVFVQVATPSRERLEHYRLTRSKVEEAVGRINGRFGSIGHSVVRYHHQSLSRAELIELYQAADVMVVTPFKDGMNLVAKEYVASHADGRGALVLSEFAGAAQELQSSYLCNPHDIDSIKSQMLCAIQDQGSEQAAQRMRTMHEQVMRCDVERWAKNFLEELLSSQ
ncbi:alpha,alpha-trehalose-phosphate synthase (UDP-forming) [Corynebacterium pelargi]|uniref:alpha,alpha-trehalose-phosphate synthase (ADP-forming) n=1 Tax=Corynebacterium pelargi TaxID=1471400 RepID=A0A410W6J8_9CORY|nr:trehalose-6-phosphate synthase [Corynebacterium pelargi]QAU51671.1 Trehalose-phosphate synthase [Corynebacterium pelargi]GGG80393.1 trehalose-6-phosphate synthase [Corynebacterium pelargi]